VRRAALIAAGVAVAYLIAAPVSADLAAQTYRAWLFDHTGFALWDNAWYGGHPLPGYSVLFPPVAALLGVRLAGALSVVAAAVLFAALVRDTPRAALGAAWFAAGVALQLLTGRMAFLFGVAVGLGALLAMQRGRRATRPERGFPARRRARRSYAAAGVGLAVATTLASPVAGAFLGLAGVAWWRRAGLALAAGAVVPGLAIALLFPEGGSEPFVPSAFWPALAALVAAAALAGARYPAVRRGALLAAGLCLVAFAVENPLGGNASRLGALFAGPLLVCVALDGPRRLAVLALLPLLAYWQLMPPIRDAVVATGDPSTEARYYAPLLARLPARRAERVEVPFTRSHWEARWLAPAVPLARGWERQLDRERNAVFYDGPLTGPRLRAWLRANAVRWVALPDAALDPSARTEAALLRAGIPGVREVWHSRHWRLYAVARTDPLGAATLGTDTFTVRARRAGTTVVRVRWSPYWAVRAGSGCVRRAARGDWTLVTARRPGILRIGQDFSLARGLAKANGPRCAALASGGPSG
jgi:hypothetical protein